MAGKIFPKSIKGNTYYYYQESYRVKIDPRANGKHKGSGKSRVRTKTIYLGTAETILALKKKTDGPASVKHRSFGMVGAAYLTAVEFGIVEALQKHITGKRGGIDRWLYFLITILNRIDCSTSKNKMSAWAHKTILPELLSFDADKLTSKNFWYATDDIISEAELKKRRNEADPDDEDIFCGLDDRVFQLIEQDVFTGLRPLLTDPARSLVYDTTNFFTYFESPDASQLAKAGHNKDSHHHLRQVGLLMAVDKLLGIPFYHRVYQGNRHDSKVFKNIVADLVASINASFSGIDELVLVLDKGNNKKETFAFLDGKIEWIGSLTPSQHQDLLSVPLEDYDGTFGEMKTLRRTKTVMGKKCELVMTYNPKLARKQERTLQRGIDKLRKALRQKYRSYKRTPKKMTRGLESMLDESRYKDYVEVTVNDDGIKVEPIEKKLAAKRKSMGKNLLFTSKKKAETAWIIIQYKEKDVIEDGFKTMKDPELLRIRPLRHWTDTKIRAFIFCCVMSYVLLRLMLYKVEQAGLSMSATVLKQELSDLREIIMLYENGRAERKITEGSTIQKKLYNLFELDEIKKELPYTILSN